MHAKLEPFLQRKTTAIWLSDRNKGFKTEGNGYLIFERLYQVVLGSI